MNNINYVDEQLKFITSNRKKFSSSGTIYRVIKAAQTHVQDVNVLPWGLRTIYYMSMDEGGSIFIIIIMSIIISIITMSILMIMR